MPSAPSPLRSLCPPPVRLGSPTREALVHSVTSAWTLNDRLFAAIDPAHMHDQPDPLRNPLVFYMGHTAAFYINKLRMAGLLTDGLHPELDELLARGVDPELPEELGRARWPAVERVAAYRAQALERVLDAIDRAALPELITPDGPLWALLMAIEHDRIHFETSSVLIRQLTPDALTTPEGWQTAPTDRQAPAQRWVTIPAREVHIGRRLSPQSWFAWDNELVDWRAQVEAFEVSPHLITQGQWRAFWEDGGYTDARLWSDEGWQWRQRTGHDHPTFWHIEGGTPRYRAMFTVIDLPEAWPAEINAHEARAFCTWFGQGARLLTEPEHRALTCAAPLVEDDSPGHDGYLLNMRLGSPRAVDAPEGVTSADGVHDVFGNVWQWTSSPWAALPGFRAHPLYEDFSAPYFDGLHDVLCGGAWATTGAGASRHYRLWFRRHFMQHAGARLARTLS